MSYNHENWQVDVGRCYGKLIGGRILIFWILLPFQKKSGQRKLNSALKAIGGSQVKKICQADLEELIGVVSTFFTDC